MIHNQISYNNSGQRKGTSPVDYAEQPLVGLSLES
jgi:hypothetical protein